MIYIFSEKGQSLLKEVTSVTEEQNELRDYYNNTEYDSLSFYQNLVLGQQVYSTMLRIYLFTVVSQDSKRCSQLARRIPSEKLLFRYVKKLGMHEIWDSDKCGISCKIRQSYVILGIQYHKQGYDNTYSSFKSAISNFIDSFLQLPITNYTHLLESYAWNTHHLKISYTTKTEKKYSDTDIDFQATASFLRKTYYALGYSKKNAIENLAHHIVNESLSVDVIAAIASTQNYLPIKKYALEFDSLGYEEKDNSIKDFAVRYGVDNLLMRFSLLTRSHMGKDAWKNLGVEEPEQFLKKESRLKKGLVDLGQNILLLQALDYNIHNNNLDAIDISSLDLMIINTGSGEVQKQLVNILKIGEFIQKLFERFEVPVKDTLTIRDMSEIGYSIITAFFMSNFSPDKKFLQYFGDTFDSFYCENGINVQIDYRFALIAYLSAFNIKVVTNHHEIENEIFHAEIILGDSITSPKYICENESMRFAKKDVWRVAYVDIVETVKKFFFAKDFNCSYDALLFFVKNVVQSNISNQAFYAGFGILNANNITKIDVNICKEIFFRLERTITDYALYNRFIEIVSNTNKKKYICINNSVYEYLGWLKNCAGVSIDPLKEIDIKLIPDIYEKIINPTTTIQKELIDINYKFVQKIYPLEYEIAEYALNTCIDAYDYLTIVSPEIASLYTKLKEKEESFSDIGELVSHIGTDTLVSIMDSHKSFYTQIETFIEELDIQSVKIACGYCFASGLSLLRNIISKTLFLDIPFELYVGALQNYDESSPDNLITGIDKSTVRILNSYLLQSNFQLFTCPDRFYHGKIYFFEGKKKTVICLGSSNISRSAFVSNYELNIVFRTKTDSELHNNFKLWINQLKHYSRRIDGLNEEMFGNNEIKQDGSVLLKHISLTSMQRRISTLSNAEIRYRLNLWMSYSPDTIAEDLGILALPNYFVFIYKKYGLMVLESFESGNAYFCISFSDSFENTINAISAFSKTEIFEFSQMAKRGYHVQNKFTLENNIRWYFRKERH